MIGRNLFGKEKILWTTLASRKLTGVPRVKMETLIKIDRGVWQLPFDILYYSAYLGWEAGNATKLWLEAVGGVSIGVDEDVTEAMGEPGSWEMA